VLLSDRSPAPVDKATIKVDKAVVLHLARTAAVAVVVAHVKNVPLRWSTVRR